MVINTVKNVINGCRKKIVIVIYVKHALLKMAVLMYIVTNAKDVLNQRGFIAINV